MNDMEGRLLILRFDRLERQITELTTLVKLAIPQEIMQAMNEIEHKTKIFRNKQEDGKK